jgi:SHS2 domain-containing protein
VNETDRKTPFRELNHTADLRVEICGKDEDELFQNAVESLYVLLGLSPLTGRREALPADSLKVHGQDLVEALVQLLGELLYRATVEGERLLLDAISIRRCEEGQGECEVEVIGKWRRLTDEEISGKREIKAVTYHNAQIRRTERGVFAEVVMDI